MSGCCSERLYHPYNETFYHTLKDWLLEQSIISCYHSAICNLLHMFLSFLYSCCTVLILLNSVRRALFHVSADAVLSGSPAYFFNRSTAVRNVVRTIPVSKGKPQTSTHVHEKPLVRSLSYWPQAIMSSVSPITQSFITHYNTLRRLGWADGWHVTTLWLFYFILLFFYYQLSRTHAQSERRDA